MTFQLVCIEPKELTQYKSDMQEAFQKGFEDAFGKTDAVILPEKEIDQSVNAEGSAVYKAVVDGEMVGMLGLCGIMGAVAASSVGKLVPRFGIHKFSLFGAAMQIIAWAIALLFGDTYAGLIAAIILVDIGLQCQQLSNQSGCLQEIPQASNRANTIFMTTYFIGGSLGTFCAGYVWTQADWLGVCIVGISFAFISLMISLSNKK